MPDPHRFSQGLPCEELSLKKVRCETWDGFVWVTLNPEAKPLGDFLGVITDILDAYRFRDMVLVKDQTVCLDANWKTVMDNFSELYHVDFLHPQHATFVDCRDDRVDLWPYGHTGVYVDGYVTNPRYPIPDDPPELLRNGLSALGLDPDEFKGRVPDIREAVQKRKREIGPELGLDYADFTDEQVSDVWQFNLFPNIIMTIKPEELWVMRPRPHATDPGKCYFDKWTLQIDPKTDGDKQKTAALALVGDPDAVSRLDGERPERQVFTQDQVIAGEHSMTITIDQDVHYLRDMQAGMLSEGYDRAWLNDDESRVQHFHDWLDVWM
ncbi:MAG: SRPBCC family protein, partial [Alphaproteobacteria bacterium]|nr:SRPBCC family protein [Alphaproteobacteria bacterium]